MTIKINQLIQSQISLANYTSYRVGGNAQWYAAPKNWEQLEACFDWYQAQDVPLTLLGAGSNLLISDRGISGLTICTRHFRNYQFESDNGLLIADAGEPIAKLAWKAAKRGFKGLEWAVGIPGTIGGAVVMNAGAHQQSLSDILVSATVLSTDGTIEVLTPEDLEFSYRTSNLQGSNKFVVRATLKLQPGFSKQEIMELASNNWTQRKTTQPYHLPSCGSVFRNPYPQAAGWLIEQLGLKGHKIGDAQIAQRHANFILNCGAAQASDIFQLIRYIQEKVEYHWSVSLEPEVKLVGEF
ncbi:UDP-N-acetylenolpyruvoylglucosamine reductase [Hyella patelloides LEGE 07179]|uniref:UDP-N-acetylenolpyruvoylglucosamine reductase n=1 Tax=Hyella patelloides LEGE 07179 TaxID=945734 RepID=A0A563VL21_9CYAN|nr:UDP-N-acetylmuramate dehydrogenase [Hyella patelloides]VEP12121.1 UDP-N-acetylenolpyruvoylglucosamine reductase [Hyella patelloides LEGE 07179]